MPQDASRALHPQSAAICLAIIAGFSLLRYFGDEVKASVGLAAYLTLEGSLLAGLAAYIWRVSRRQHATDHVTLRPASPVAGPVASHRADPLLTLRFFACFLVLAGHGFIINFPPQDFLSDMRQHVPYSYFLPEPWAGVWVFFVLSGYLMGKGFFRGRYTAAWVSSLCFYRNRVLRIVPLYTFCTLLVAFLVKPAFFAPHNLWKLAALLLFFDPGDSPRPNDALWSVCAEMEFYLMVPFIFVLGRNLLTRHPAVCFGAILAAGFALHCAEIHFFSHKMALFTGPALRFMDVFLAGFALNAVIQRYKTAFALRHGILAALLILLGYYFISAWFCRTGRILHISTDYRALMLLLPTATIVVISAVIFLMETGTLAREHFLVRGIVAATQLLGLLTYSIYTWHEPLFFALAGAFKKIVPTLQLAGSLGLLLFSCGVLLLIALPSYYLIELYFERKKKLT